MFLGQNAKKHLQKERQCDNICEGKTNVLPMQTIGAQEDHFYRVWRVMRQTERSLDTYRSNGGDVCQRAVNIL